MKKMALVCVCVGCGGLMAAAATMHWSGAGSDTLYSNPLNWGGTVPAQGDNGYFSSATPAIVTFPMGGYTDKSTTETAANSDVTFDTRGTWWLKPADSTWGNPTFRVGGGAHGFNIESVNSAKAQMLLSNAVLRAVADGESITTELKSGSLNFYDPDGIDSANTIVIGHDNNRKHYVTLEPGTTSRWQNIAFRAKGPENIIRINGGFHEVFNNFDIANTGDRPGSTGLVVIAGGELVTHYYNHLGANPAQIGRVVIETGGMWRSKQSVEIGYNNGYGVLDIAGGTLYQDAETRSHELIIGRTARGTGVVNVTAGHLINTNSQIFVGSEGAGFMNVSGGQVNTKYMHVGRQNTTTGAVVMTGGTWINEGNGSVGYAGYGTCVISGGVFSVDNDWFAVGKDASSAGRMTIAGGRTSLYDISPGRDGGDGILNVTGGTNRFYNFTMGRIPSVRSFAWISGGSNEMWGGSGMLVGLNGKGELLVDGGVSSTTQIRLGQSNSQDGLASIMTISGGVVRVQNNINIADNKDNSGILRLHGGVLETPNIRGWTGAAVKGGNGIATLEADGGTLRINRSNNAADFLKDFDIALLGANGLTLDCATYNVTVAQAFADMPDAAGEFIKTGSGTLTLSGANTHTRTVVANGTVTIADAGTLGNGAIVTNSATLSLAGTPSLLTLEMLTLGDADTSGWLALDLDDTISVTQPDGLSMSRAWLKLTDATLDGTYTLFNCAGNIALSALNGLDVANPVAGKAYTFAVVYDSGTDTSDIMLTIQDATTLSVPQYVWTGSTGSAWGTLGNWTGNLTPLAGVAAVFPDEALSKTVAVAPGAVAGGLRFGAADSYTLTGTDALTLDNNSRAGDIVVSAGAHTIAAPLSLPRAVAVAVASGATATVSGQVTGAGGIHKLGDGALTLTAANTFTGRLAADGGLLDVTADNAFGSASPDRANLTLASGTLRY